MVKILELPLELKVQIIEYDPQIIKSLLLVDSSIYNYYKSDDCKRWLRRIASTNIDTYFERGTLLADNIKDGEWDYYKKRCGGRDLSKIEKYNFGHLYEIITWPIGSIKIVTPMINGLKNGVMIRYNRYLKYICETTTFVDGKKVGEYKRYKLLKD